MATSSSARKLFIGIEAPAAIASDLAKHIGLDADATTQHPPHITLQYCGKEVSDSDILKIKEAWLAALTIVALNPQYDTMIETTGKLDLYGLNHDQLVALCAAAPKLYAAVKMARAAVLKALPHIPPSDFDFSPHITLGSACEIPAGVVVPPTAFHFYTLFLWGDAGEVRDKITVPFADAA